MTGFGEARLQNQRWTIVVEVRTVNNRHFKLSAKISDSYAMIEPALEQLVREKVRRGTVQLSLRIDRPRRPEDYRVNLVALASYRDQLKGLRGFDDRTLDISQLLVLPGVVEDGTGQAVSDRGLARDRRGGRRGALRSSRPPCRRRRGDGRRAARLGHAILDQLSLIAERGPLVVQAHKRASASGFGRS